MTREDKYNRRGSKPPKLEIKGVCPGLGGSPCPLGQQRVPNFKVQEARARTLPKDRAGHCKYLRVLQILLYSHSLFTVSQAFIS